MQISEHRLILFIELYKETFGVALSRSEAHEKASLLLRYTLLCIKPLADHNGDDTIEQRNENE